jgi:hypothetical protein
MPNYDHVHVHGFNVARRIDERFAFGQTATRRRKLDRIRSHATSGKRKTGTSSRGILKEKVGTSATGQSGDFLAATTG